jgi:hypothetical protein
MEVTEYTYEVPGAYCVGFRLPPVSARSIALAVERNNIIYKLELIKADSFKFGGRSAGNELYFPTDDARQQFLTWKRLKWVS